jgi:hypothetical protein
VQGSPFGGAQNGDTYGGAYDPRQYARELQERLTDIRELQRLVGPNTEEGRELQAIANNLQGLIRDPRVGDPQAIARLADQIIEPFRGIEMELSRSLQILLAKENIRSAQEHEIPAGYQKLVEEYYKKLSSTTSTVTQK